MLGEVPKLFGRDFVVGFLLPAALFVSYATYFLNVDPLGAGPAAGATADTLARLTLLVFVIALGLFVFNRPMVRFVEGYGPLRLIARIKNIEVVQFRRKVSPVLKERARIEAALRRGKRPKPKAGYVVRLRAAIGRFPHREDLVLPTRFGNTYRAYEMYAKEVYGIDSVVLWSRILCVVPADVKDQLASSRCNLDFNINIFWLSVIAVVSTVVLVGPFGSIPPLLVTVWTWIRLPGAAARWGNSFAAIFDMYRGPLATGLGLKIPASAQEERVMWDEVSRMIRFHSSDSATRLDERRCAIRTEAETFVPVFGDLYVKVQEPFQDE